MASAVLGTMLMLGLMASMIPGAIIMVNSWNDAISASTEAAQLAAWCARHPEAGPERGCPETRDMAGCTRVADAEIRGIATSGESYWRCP